MEPVKFEIIAIDKSKPATDSAEQNVDHLSAKIEEQKVLIASLQSELKLMQDAASKGTGVRTVDDVVMVDKLEKKIKELQATIKELEAQKKQTNSVPFITPNATEPIDKIINKSNNLSFSVQQVARELPSLAMGPQMFFLAISNNLPILSDQIRIAKQEYNELAAAGQKGVPVWKQVTSSIFSWQTALVAGITLLVMNGKAIGEWISGLGKSRKELDANRVALDNLSSARAKGAQNAQAELTRLALLYKATQDDTLAKNERNKAVDELQKKYPDYFGNMSNEAILAGKAASAYVTLSRAIIESTRARALEDTIIAKQKELLDNRGKIAKVSAELLQIKKFTGSNPWAAQAGVGDVHPTEEWSNKNDELKPLLKQKEILENTIKKLAGEIKPSALVDDVHAAPDKPKSEKDTTNIKDSIADAQIKAEKHIQDMILATMQEGYAKRKEEARNEFLDEMNRINIEERERLEKIAIAKKNKISVTPQQINSVTEQANIQRQLAADVYNNKKKNIDVDEQNTLIEKYQSYTDQRLAIEQKYNTDIARMSKLREEAQQAGDQGTVDKLTSAIIAAQGQKAKGQMKASYDQFVASPEYIRAFEDLDNTSTSTLEHLAAELEKYKLQAAQNLDPQSLREYSITLQEIVDNIAGRDLFGTLAQQRAELAAAETELATASANLATVKSGSKVQVGERVDPATGAKTAVYLDEEQALNQVNKAKDKYVKANNNVTKTERKVADQVDNLCASVKAVGAAVGGQAGQIIGLIGDIGMFAMSCMTGVSGASKTASKSVQAVEKASIILAIITTAIQIATKIVDMFKDDDGTAAYEAAKKTYESYLSILDEVIAKQKELFKYNDANGESAFKQAQKMLRDSADAARDMGKKYLDTGASNGFLGIGSSPSHGVSQRKNISDKAWKQAKAALGADFYTYGIDKGRMTGLFDLPIEKLRALQKDAISFLTELDDDTRKYIDDILKAEDSLQENENERKTGLVGADLEGFESTYIDLLTQLDSTNQDFSAKFGEYIKNALLSSLVNTKYKKEIDGLYEDWAKATESDKELTAEEAERLKKKQQELADRLLKERENMMKAYGIKDNDAEQSGQRGVISNVTEETASKLDGSLIAQTNRLISVDEKLFDITKLLDRALAPLFAIAENTKRAAELLALIQNDTTTMRRDGVTIKN